MSDERPNILFLMTDHQRADSLGRVQAGVEVTPRLNELAARSVVFDRAYNTCPLCVPARTALATGKYPTHNGVVFNDWDGARAGCHATLQECLYAADYEMAHVGVHHVRVRPDLRKRVYFDCWCDTREHGRNLAARGIDPLPAGGRRAYQREVLERHGEAREPVRYSSTRTGVWGHDEGDFLDAFLCRRAVEFVRRRRERPFALFLCLWAPHPPLIVPRRLAGLFDPARLDLPANVGTPGRREPPGRRRGIAAQLAEGVTPDEWRDVWAAHLALVRLADDGLGTVLDAVEAGAQDRPTLVVFTTDHGEFLGQHALYQKMEMYEPAVRVPLIVHAPGGPAGRHDGCVSHLDVFPTLLDLLGIEPPEGLDGVSLARTLSAGAELPERAVFAQYSGNPTVGDIRRAVITRRYKYVYDPDDIPELYDLAADPLEMNNLAAEPAHADLLAGLHEQCAAWHETHGDWVSFDRAAGRA